MLGYRDLIVCRGSSSMLGYRDFHIFRVGAKQ